LEIPDGVKAYTGTLNGSWLTLNEIEGATLPHNTGVVLELEADFASLDESAKTKVFTILSTKTDGTSALTGDIVAQSVTANTKLVLGKSGDDWGIYSFSGTKLDAFKAYMNKPAGVKGFAFRFDDVESLVEALNTQEANRSVVYNLAGQRVEKASRGLYIMGGKKVVVK
jgi:hypothetical protein